MTGPEVVPSATPPLPEAPPPPDNAGPTAIFSPVAPSPADRYPTLVPPEEPLPLLVMLPEQAKQRRWTVLLRAILAIPLAVVVLFVGIAASVCAVLGWFAALVTGRAPEFVRTIVAVYLRMMLRLEAYVFLLTDRFPPFSGDDAPGYEARLAVPPATRLNRAAVLFRLILVIPASIAVRVVGLGMYVVAFFMWVVVLITGWLPKSAHQAYQVFIRYELRVIGYFELLVPTYPGEVFGDLVPVPVPVPVPPVLVAPGAAGGLDVDAPAPAPLPLPLPLPPLPQEQRQPWKLVLGLGAKRFLVVTIVIGIGALIGLGVLKASIQDHENLVQVNNQLASSLDQFSTTATHCQSVACLEHADAVLSRQFGAFVSALQGSDHAGVSQALVTQVTGAAQKAERVTNTLAQAGPTLSGYRSTAARLDASRTLDALASAQRQFANALNASRLG